MGQSSSGGGVWVVEEEVPLGYFFLPVVLGTALGAGLAVLQGVVDGVHDGGVLVSDVHAENIYH